MEKKQDETIYEYRHIHAFTFKNFIILHYKNLYHKHWFKDLLSFCFSELYTNNVNCSSANDE